MSFPPQDYLPTFPAPPQMMPQGNLNFGQTPNPMLGYFPGMYGQPTIPPRQNFSFPEMNRMMPPLFQYPFMMMPQGQRMQQRPFFFQQMPQNFPLQSPLEVEIKSPIPEQQLQQEKTRDKSQFVEVEGSKVWLNLSLINQTRKCDSNSEQSKQDEFNSDSVLDYDQILEERKDKRKSSIKLEKQRSSKRRISQNLVEKQLSGNEGSQDEEEIFYKRIKKGDGKTRIGNNFQVSLDKIASNKNVIKTRLRSFQKCDESMVQDGVKNSVSHENVQINEFKQPEIYQLIKDQGYSDDQAQTILDSYQDHEQLEKKIKEKCPFLIKEIEQILDG